jgi:hypothetical protein
MVIPLTTYGRNFVVRECDLCRPTGFRILNLRDGKPYAGTNVIIDATTKNMIIDTSRPLFAQLAVEAYFGTAKETQCSFIKPVRYSLMFKICGDETL